MTDARPEQWQNGFAACRRAAEALVGGCSPEALARRPEAGAWSAAECLGHLLATGRPLVAPLQGALARAPAATAAPRLGWLDRLFAWIVQPGHWLKIPAPAPYRPPPPGAQAPAQAAAAFAALQDDLASCARAAAGRDWAAVRVPSPANRFVRLTAGGWLAGTLAHQRRHLRQARAALP